MNKRVIVIVIDSLGVGAMPDCAEYNDAPTVNTMGNIDQNVDQLSLPNLASLGLGNILPLSHVQPDANARGSWGKMAEVSRGKDTTTGHWEMMGVVLENPLPTYPEGFPEHLVRQFVEESGCQGVLGNVPASGTAIIEEHGAKHLETGWPILYTSADSVFQLACHVEKVPLETLYRWCEIARRILKDEHEVSRVIARPFMGEPGRFERLGGDRKDFAISPPPGTCLDLVKQAGGVVLGIGKIEDIFCQAGITHAIHTKGNTHGLEITGQAISGDLDLGSLSIEGKGLEAYDTTRQFVFVNLVDTDMKYGHRRNVTGYARALEEIDAVLGRYLDTMGSGDLLMITGDHGCDPTAPGSDHTREYIPILLYSPALPGGRDLGERSGFFDIGRTVLDWLDLPQMQLLGESMVAREPAS